ncbi:MAG: peptide-binding protein [Candidatus Omnitrophota bacterium]
MKKAFRKPRIVVAAFLLLCAAAKAPADVSEEKSGTAPSYGDAIVVASLGDAKNLIPILASDSASGEICSLVFNGLVKYDKNIRLVGDLAERWEITEDGLTIVFYLRRGVRWHDGAPFTARDVEFTYTALIDPNVKTPYSGDFERVESFEVIDDHTVRVTYKEPFAPALASWGMSIMPRHILDGVDLDTTGFSRHPVGTGPYMFRKWKTGQKIELFSNHDYFEGRPYIERYIYRIIPDASTIFLELQVQAVDMAQLTPLQYTRQTDGGAFAKRFRKFHFPSFGYTYMGYNLSNNIFSDKRVRQAMQYAVDKKEIIDGVLFGLGKPCAGPFPPESWANNPDVRPAPRDPGRARRLLDEAGWSDSDGDGWIDRKGKPFEFTVITNQGNRERIMTAEVIQKRLEDVGIKMKIRVLEWATFLDFINKKNFDACILGWSLSRDPDCYDIWHSSKTREGEFNFIGYRNDEVDTLLERGRRTFDQGERKKIYHRIQEILYDEQPYMFLYVPDSLPALHRRFRNVEIAPIGIGHNFIRWFVPERDQRYRVTPR